MRSGEAIRRRLGIIFIVMSLLAPLSIAPTLAQDEPADTDGDRVVDSEDTCPDAFNPAQLDADEDGIGDACDAVNDDDVDADFVPNERDNCPDTANLAQLDFDRDGIGNACDATPNGENIETDTDTSTDTETSTETDIDTDTSTENATTPALPDSDDDGIPDGEDNCALDPNSDQANADGDRFGDACDPTPDGGLVPNDTDGDMVRDDDDNCPDVPNTLQLDADNDGIGDACDSSDIPSGALVTVDLAGPERVIAPDRIRYTITVTSMTDTLNTVILSQELPRGDTLDWSTSTPDCQILTVRGQARLLCPRIIFMGNGETFTAHVSSSTSETMCGDTLTTTTIAKPGQGDPVTSAATSTDVLCQTALVVTTTPDDGEVAPGSNMSYTITVANSGRYDAVDATLSAPLPEGVTWQANAGTTFDLCGISEGRLTCAADLLPQGESRSVTISGILPAEIASCELDLAMTATAKADNAEQANDGGDAAIICKPDVTITMTTIPADGTATAGEDIGFVITLTNAGFGAANDAGVTLTALPATLDWALGDDTPAGCELAEDTHLLTCTGLDLSGTDGAPNGDDTATVTVTATTRFVRESLCDGVKATAVLTGDDANGESDDRATVQLTDCTNALALCEQAALTDGFLNLESYDLVAGTDGNDHFVPTGAQELFCGFGGDDTIDTFAGGDVFLGGQGTDRVTTLNGGTFNGDEGDDKVSILGDPAAATGDGVFNGGDDNDSVESQKAGRFIGADGKDTVNLMTGGIFDGDEDTDSVASMKDGYFDGGTGDDTVTTMQDGIFVGGEGTDTITTMHNGQFTGRAGNDTVTTMEAGYFTGDADADSVTTLLGGSFNGRDGNDTVTNLGDPQTNEGTGVFNGGDKDDTVENAYSGTFNGEGGNDSVINYSGGVIDLGPQP